MPFNQWNLDDNVKNNSQQLCNLHDTRFSKHVFNMLTKIFYLTYFTCGQVRNDPTMQSNSQQKPADTSWDENV